MNLYRVSVFDGSDGLAVWERFGHDEAHVVETTLEAARREWPTATDLEVFVNGRLPYPLPNDYQRAWLSRESENTALGSRVPDGLTPGATVTVTTPSGKHVVQGAVLEITPRGTIVVGCDGRRWSVDVTWVRVQVTEQAS